MDAKSISKWLKEESPSFFEQEFIAESFCYLLFDIEESDYYLFNQDERGDGAWLRPVNETGHETIFVKKQDKLSHQVVPTICYFNHCEPIRLEWIEDRQFKRVKTKVANGAKSFASKVNQAIVDVLIKASKNNNASLLVSDKQNNFEEFLLLVSEEIAQNGYYANTILIPRIFIPRLLSMGIVLKDDNVSSNHYVGKTKTGLQVFGVEQLPENTALIFDSSAGVSIIGTSNFYFEPKLYPFISGVCGSLRFNPIFKNTVAVFSYEGIQELLIEKKSGVDVLLVTVTKVETIAVFSVVEKEFGRKPIQNYIGDKTFYDLGEIGGANVYLVRSEMGASGPGGSTTTILESISQLSPSAIIMVGIAFGVNSKKQSIGDILISSQLMGYEPQRVGSDPDKKQTREYRGDKPSASPRLIDRFKDGELYWEGEKVQFGLILSGLKLIDNLEFRSELIEREPEAIGGEMEGSGLYDAAHLRKVDWILVKAICDWADGNKSENKQEYQKLAAQNAAAFVIHVIAQGGFAPQ